MKLVQVVILIFFSLFATVQSMTAEELTKQVAANNIIKITDKNYEKILNDRKDYSVLLYITATSARVGCVLCTEVQPVINTLASSYLENLRAHDSSEDGAQNVFFGVADFADNKKFFGELGLQTVPKLYLYTPTTKRSSQNIMKFEEYNFLAGDHYTNIVSFITEFTKLSLDLFEIHEPTDYSKVLTKLSFVLLLVVILYKGYYKFDKVFRSSFLYKILSLGAIFSLTSGFMYNKIRQTPYSREKDGATYYFLPGHQQQLGAETQLVSIVYFGLFLAMWFLISRVPETTDAKARLVSVIALNICIFVLYSLVISFYHIKNSGYPFYLTTLL